MDNTKDKMIQLPVSLSEQTDPAQEEVSERASLGSSASDRCSELGTVHQVPAQQTTTDSQRKKAEIFVNIQQEELNLSEEEVFKPKGKVRRSPVMDRSYSDREEDRRFQEKGQIEPRKITDTAGNASTPTKMGGDRPGKKRKISRSPQEAQEATNSAEGVEVILQDVKR